MEEKKSSRFLVKKKEIEKTVENGNSKEFASCPYNGKNCADNHVCIYGIFDEMRKCELN